VRLSNAFGSKPVTFAEVHLGLQESGSAVVRGTNRPAAFAGARSVTVPPGGSAWSDPIPLPFACGSRPETLAGRKLAVSFHVPGESGPMTWHAKALQTSYLTAPGAGARSADEGEAAFPFSTTSWFFLDALDVAAPGGRAIVAFGDSLTDGTNSTLNGDDRWPDVLARRLRAPHVSVVNAGIGGNQVVGPAEYLPESPFAGGPSAVSRLDRDVLSLSGVCAVIWLEGINDFNDTHHASAEAVWAGMTEAVGRMRARIPGIRLVGATLPSALGSPRGSAAQDERRRALNALLRKDAGTLFDAIADFDRATVDPATGQLRPEMVPNTSIGGPGDKLHPNRLGLAAMAAAIDPGPLERCLSKEKRSPRPR
jgi:lysophospholipase L1-like esterase